MKNYLITICLFLMITSMTSCSGCKSCKGDGEPEVSVAGRPVVLETYEYEDIEEPVVEKGPKIRRIDIGPSGRTIVEDLEPEVAGAEEGSLDDVVLPPNTVEETDLSARLKEKMIDAYAGKEDAIPDVKIYTSDMNYDEFISYYSNLGYKVQTVAVPATQIIEPVLEQRPEMAGKIKLSDYEDVVIHQVMIDDAGISAADKYIDPDTFEVINKTFVTKMNK